MEDEVKKAVLNQVVNMLVNQLFTGQSDNFSVWTEELYDENDKPILTSEAEKELINKVSNAVNEVSAILADC